MFEAIIGLNTLCVSLSLLLNITSHLVTVAYKQLSAGVTVSLFHNMVI